MINIVIDNVVMEEEVGIVGIESNLRVWKFWLFYEI